MQDIGVGIVGGGYMGRAQGAEHLVLNDSISERRVPAAGRALEAEQMDAVEWAAYRDRIQTVARMGTEEYGLTGDTSPRADATANRDDLQSIGF